MQEFPLSAHELESRIERNEAAGIFESRANLLKLSHGQVGLGSPVVASGISRVQFDGGQAILQGGLVPAQHQAGCGAISIQDRHIWGELYGVPAPSIRNSKRLE
jgi:hypothetical protein